MAYGFNEDRSKVEVYSAAQIDAMDLVNDEALADEVEARQAAVSQEAAARSAAVSQEAAARSAGDTSLNARISNIIAQGQSTEGNTELIDIRTGYDGKAYLTAGDAVRKTIAQRAVYNLIDEAIQSNGVFSFDESATFLNLEQGALNSDGSERESNFSVRSGYIPIPQTVCASISINNNSTFGIYFYLFDKIFNFISRSLITQNNVKTLDTPNVAYARIEIVSSTAITPSSSFDFSISIEDFSQSEQSSILSLAINEEVKIPARFKKGSLSSGIDVDSAYAVASCFIPTNGFKIKASKEPGITGMMLYCFNYDSEKNYMSHTSNSSMVQSNDVAAFVRFCTYSETVSQDDQLTAVTVTCESPYEMKNLQDDVTDLKTNVDKKISISSMFGEYAYAVDKIEVGANINNDGTSTYIYKNIVPAHSPLQSRIVDIYCRNISGSIDSKPIVVYFYDQDNTLLPYQPKFKSGKFSILAPTDAVSYSVRLYPSTNGGLSTPAVFTNIFVKNGPESNIRFSNIELPHDSLIPAYYFENNYIDSKIDSLDSLIKDADANCDVFIFCTDQHWGLNARQSPKLINYICNHIQIPRMFMGGDYGAGIVPDAINAYRSMFNGKIYDITGNHEFNQMIMGDDENYSRSYQVDGDTIWSYLDLKMTDANIGSAHRNYYYVDNYMNKLRYIILNEWNYSSSIVYEFEQSQINWLEDSIDSMPDGFMAVIFIHAISSVDHSTGALSRNYAYPEIMGIANAQASKVFAVIGGHTHFDGFELSDGGIPVFVTTCDKCLPQAGYDDYLSSTRIKGTITEQAFDIFVLDRKNNRVSALRIGCPADNPQGLPLELRQLSHS